MEVDLHCFGCLLSQPCHKRELDQDNEESIYISPIEASALGSSPLFDVAHFHCRSEEISDFILNTEQEPNELVLELWNNCSYHVHHLLAKATPNSDKFTAPRGGVDVFRCHDDGRAPQCRQEDYLVSQFNDRGRAWR